MYRNAEDGFIKLMAKLVRTTKPEVNISEDAPVLHELDYLSYAPMSGMAGHGVIRGIRWKVRALAALWPAANYSLLTTNIDAVLKNPNISRSQLRLVLEGRSLTDGSKTNELPIEKIQLIGLLLSRGKKITKVASAVGVDTETVRRIDKFLGITQRALDDRMSDAVDAVRVGESARTFGARHNLSRMQANEYLRKGQKVLDELGETYPPRVSFKDKKGSNNA